MAPPSLLAHLDSSKDSTALSLAYASAGDEGCNSIARYMRENGVLKTVDLRGNNIRADGLVVLSHALRSGSSITSLCLKWNHVGSHERGLRALSDALKTNATVSNLDLRNNKIGVECGAILGDLLKNNSALTHLDISWNDLGPEGGKELLAGLQSNHSLIDCQLSGNRVAEDTLHAIAFILRRNRQNAPLSNTAFREGQEMPAAITAVAPSPVSPPRPPIYTASDATSRGFAMEVASATPDTAALPIASTAPKGRVVQDEGLALKLLQKEQNYTNAEDARFFGEVAEYIDLLQLDVARNKKYRMDAEERERVVTKGFMEREMRYAQEMRELETLLAKAKAEKDDLLHDTQYLQNEIERVQTQKANTLQDRMKLEEIAKVTANRLRCDIRDGLTVKTDLQTEIFKLKKRQEEHQDENHRLRTYLNKCREDLDRALHLRKEN